MPVLRLSLTSWSRACLDKRMWSIAILITRGSRARLQCPQGSHRKPNDNLIRRSALAWRSESGRSPRRSKAEGPDGSHVENTSRKDYSDGRNLADPEACQ